MADRNRRKITLLLIFFFAFSLVYAGGPSIFSGCPAQAAVATDGTDDEVRPPVETPPSPPQTTPKPPLVVRPPSPPTPSQPAGPAVSITDVRVRNEDKEGNALSDYKISFDYDETRWISYYIRLINNTDERLRGKIGIRYIQPDGKLKQSSKSPSGFTFEQAVDLEESVEMTGGWGKASGGTFEPGRHRVEFWWGGQRIHQLTFAVNEPETTLKISSVKLRNEMKDTTPLSDFVRTFPRSELQYVTFYLQLENTTTLAQKGPLGVKFIGPDGVMLKGKSSPEGYTFTQSINIKDSATVSNGWGNSGGNAFANGRQRIEFWWNDKKIGQVFFEVN